MRNFISLILGFGLLVLLNASTYTLPEYQQAIILQLGKIAGDPVTKAGLHFKIPFIQEVTYLDKRILQWDIDSRSAAPVPTRDKKFIWVDTTARWRINDALKFYRAVRDEKSAIFRMGPIIDGATKDLVSNHDLIESVRNSNAILKDIEDNRTGLREGEQHGSNVDSEDAVLKDFMAEVQEVRVGREQLSEMIAERARGRLNELGIGLIDVQLRSIAYQPSVEAKVFQSMVSERKQIAVKILASGEGARAEVMGQLDLTLKRIESEAYRKAQLLRGKAEAESYAIYAKSLGADPKFYEFIKNLEVYKNTIAKNGEFVLSTDNSFLDLLRVGT